MNLIRLKKMLSCLRLINSATTLVAFWVNKAASDLTVDLFALIWHNPFSISCLLKAIFYSWFPIAIAFWLIYSSTFFLLSKIRACFHLNQTVFYILASIDLLRYFTRIYRCLSLFAFCFQVTNPYCYPPIWDLITHFFKVWLAPVIKTPLNL